MARPQVLIFDVNETLLDLAVLRPRFVEQFGSADPMGEWFVRALHGSLVANHTNRFRGFGLIAAEALLVTAERRGIPPDLEAAAALMEQMRLLPPYPDVVAGLGQLAGHGFRLAALSNNAAATLADQLGHAGINDFFERVLSVEEVGRFKPAPEVYLHAAAVLGVEVDQALMIAAHGWDVLGARSVGMPGAFLARPSAIWGLPDPPPALVAPDLSVLAELLTERSDVA